MLKNVQLRTPLKDDYEAAKEVAVALKKSKKFDGTKIFLCRQVAGIAVPKGEKQDPYVHSFTFVSNDKDELQKLADNFNKILFPNHEKDKLLGVNVRKNTDNYEDVFWIRTEESEKLEEATVNNKVYVLFRNSEYHEPLAICSQLDDAKQIANSMRDEYGDEDLVVEMWPLNKYISAADDCKSWTV